jgi:hypothetical protein
MKRHTTQAVTILTALTAMAWSANVRAGDYDDYGDYDEGAADATVSTPALERASEAADEVYSSPPPVSATTGASSHVMTAPGYAPERDYMVRQYVTPNAALITSGVIMFGASYGSSIVVATQSDHRGDNQLYIPVAGPWLDLAHRGTCRSSIDVSCQNETTNKVLLVADGVFQGLGVLQILGGLIFPETHTEILSRPIAKGVHISPTAGRTGAGLTAYGKF